MERVVGRVRVEGACVCEYGGRNNNTVRTDTLASLQAYHLCNPISRETFPVTDSSTETVSDNLSFSFHSCNQALLICNTHPYLCISPLEPVQ